MTTLALSAPSAYHASLTSTSAVSSEGREIDSKIRLSEAGTSGVGYSAAQDSLVAEIVQLMNECAEDNWDGDGSKAIDILSAATAVHIINGLPLNTPLPEVGLDPDGEVSLEWHLRPRYALSVSVGRDGTLSFAGLFGENRLRGVEVSSDGFPPTIVAALHRLYR
jgi:hypothetical protein